MEDQSGYLFKRTFDVLLASLMLPVLLPLGLLCALLVWFEDRFEVLHYHEVVGLGGLPFKMITFRTLAPGVHRMFEGDRVQEDDPGTTNVGRFLLNSRLERLPVLINVLRGQMSFVGPSPERTEAAAVLRRKVPRYAQRYRVRPGLISLAEIFGEPGMPVSTRLRYDLFYIERMSLVWDLRLIRGEIRRRLRGTSGLGLDVGLPPATVAAPSPRRATRSTTSSASMEVVQPGKADPRAVTAPPGSEASSSQEPASGQDAVEHGGGESQHASSSALDETGVALSSPEAESPSAPGTRSAAAGRADETPGLASGTSES